MATGAEILRKMIAAQAGDGPPDYPAPAALNLALGRVTHEQFNDDGEVVSPQSEVVERDDLLKLVPTPALIMPLETDAGRFGLMWFDPILVNAVVELMTAAPRRLVLLEPREPTAIDAALCREFAQGVLCDFGAALAEILGHDVLAPLGFLPYETDIQNLKFQIEPGAHRITSGRVEFQGGVRGGDMAIALPLDLWSGSIDGGGAEDDGFSRQLAQNVWAAPLRLRVELQVISMPVVRAIGFSVGDIIPLSGRALSNVTLMTKEGIRLFHGRLGQKDGHKAVSLSRGAPGVVLLPASDLTPDIPDAATESPTQDQQDADELQIAGGGAGEIEDMPPATPTAADLDIVSAEAEGPAP